MWLLLLIAALAASGVAECVTEDHPGDCLAVKEKIQDELTEALDTQGRFVVQQGRVDLSQVGLDDGFDCDAQDCYFSNPSSGYSFIHLPLSPEEDIEEKRRMVDDLPEWEAANLNRSDGMGANWQLRHDEVVVLFGCTPPAGGSRYFGVTPYMHGMYSSKQEQWIRIESAMGDTIGIVRAFNSKFGFENRLKTAAQQPDDVDLSSDGDGLENAFSKITIVLMGASKSTVQRAKEAAESVLGEHGVTGVVNTLGIPRDFGDVGLPTGSESNFSYYSVVVRSIFDSNEDVYKEYAQNTPLSAWRLTPKRRIPFYKRNSFPPAEVIPRLQAEKVFTNETVLMDGVNLLISNIKEVYETTHVAAHSLIARPIWQSIDVDYGRDCVDREVTVCLHDNRDVVFVSVLPFLMLDIPEKFTYVVGVNHKVTGTVMYHSIALNQWEKQIGVAAADDEAMIGSANQFLKGTAFEDMQDSFFAIRLARDCGEAPFCLEIATEGGRAIAMGEDSLLLERLYVSPATGVGPYHKDIVLPQSITFTPIEKSTEEDIVSQVDTSSSSVCLKPVVGLGTCANGFSNSCCEAMKQFRDEECFCTEHGEIVANALQQSMQSLRILALVCGVEPKNFAC